MYVTSVPRNQPRRAVRTTLSVVIIVAAVAVVATICSVAFAMLSAVVSQYPSENGTVHSSAAIGEAGGLLPEGATPFDDTPGITGLEPNLRDALQKATTDAAAEGIHVIVNSGWRSEAYQQQLLKEAVSTYGSESEASRWVATPATSAHVHGDAVDVGSFDATIWLSERGSEYGLCQIYENEPWHYELRPEAINEGCPQMFRDATEDPRMHR